MKAIETQWRGWRFRSRTEARWAVALTVAGIQFEYEREGFDLPSGWYLPDFWLPTRKAWLEIKGVAPTAREIALAKELATGGHRVLIAVGPPDPNTIHLEMHDGPDEPLDELFELPDAAYAAARAERFDGKPLPSQSVKPRRWW